MRAIRKKRRFKGDSDLSRIFGAHEYMLFQNLFSLENKARKIEEDERADLAEKIERAAWQRW